MPTFRPARPTGDDAESRYHQAVWDILFGDQSLFMDTRGQPLRFEKQNGKYVPRLTLPTGKQGADNGFIGEIDMSGATVYKVRQWGVIRTGTPLGTYICIKETDAATNPPTQPDTGNLFWLSLSNGDTIGNWL